MLTIEDLEALALEAFLTWVHESYNDDPPHLTDLDWLTLA